MSKSMWLRNWFAKNELRLGREHPEEVLKKVDALQQGTLSVYFENHFRQETARRWQPSNRHVTQRNRENFIR